MRKFVSVIAALMTTCVMFTGCGSEESSTVQTKIGMLAGLNASEQKYQASLEIQAKRSKTKLAHHEYVMYDNLNGMLMGLGGGDISELSTYESVADYLLERRAELTHLEDHDFNPPLIDKFCCAVKADNKELLDDINGALKSMKADGTLEALTEKYINDVKGEPEAVAMPSIEGAPTIKVAVTGDLPPLDLIRADGTPAGFNTAVMSEIGRRINRNVELVSVESAARASALESGNVDMIFWVRMPKEDSLFSLKFDLPDGLEVSEQYFEDETVHIGKK